MALAERSSFEKMLQDDELVNVLNSMMQDPRYGRVISELQTVLEKEGNTDDAALHSKDTQEVITRLGSLLAQDKNRKQELAALLTAEQVEYIQQSWSVLEADPETSVALKEVLQKGETALVRHWDNDSLLEKFARGMEAPQVLEVIADSAAYDAALADNTSALTSCCTKGCNVDYMGQYGTALHISASYGVFSQVKVLLEHNADVNVYHESPPSPQFTPLIALANGIKRELNKASDQQYLQCAQALLERGADVSITDNNGQTAFNIVQDARDALEDDVDNGNDESGSKTQYLRVAKSVYKLLKEHQKR